jgi:hypothetical protein
LSSFHANDLTKLYMGRLTSSVGRSAYPMFLLNEPKSTYARKDKKLTSGILLVLSTGPRRGGGEGGGGPDPAAAGEGGRGRADQGAEGRRTPSTTLSTPLSGSMNRMLRLLRFFILVNVQSVCIAGAICLFF